MSNIMESPEIVAALKYQQEWNGKKSANGLVEYWAKLTIYHDRCVYSRYAHVYVGVKGEIYSHFKSFKLHTVTGAVVSFIQAGL